MTIVKDVLTLVFMPEWNTHGYICKDGTIYIQLILGRCFTKKEFLKLEKDGEHNKEFINKRIKLFDDLEDYYKKYKKRN